MLPKSLQENFDALESYRFLISKITIYQKLIEIIEPQIRSYYETREASNKSCAIELIRMSLIDFSYALKKLYEDYE